MESLNFAINTHASICINGNIYIDPFKISTAKNNADFIFITHSHWDHLDIESIKNVMNEKTIFICPCDCFDEINKICNDEKRIVLVKPSSNVLLHNGIQQDITCEVFASYNLNKPFHPKSNNWVGYNINIAGRKYMICGDSDLTDELKQQSTNVLFVPIGGTYTMDAIDGAKLTNIINPDLVVPMHYGEIVGDADCEEAFIKNLDKNIKYKLLI